MLRAYYQDFHALVASLLSMNILSYLPKDLIGGSKLCLRLFPFICVASSAIGIILLNSLNRDQQLP